MHKAERLALVLTPAEEGAVVEMAGADGGVLQSVLVRRLICHAARKRATWPPNRQRRINPQLQEVQHG